MPDATAIAPRLLETARQAAHPLTGAAEECDPLLDPVGLDPVGLEGRLLKCSVDDEPAGPFSPRDSSGRCESPPAW